MNGTPPPLEDITRAYPTPTKVQYTLTVTLHIPTFYIYKVFNRFVLF